MGGGRVLITGGAGFIGSHVTDALLAAGYTVRILDALTPQVHPGASGTKPPYLHGDAELLVGDVRDPDAVRQALQGVDAVCHLAAAVGVGQSMYQIAHYTAVNNLGTAVLLEALAVRPVARLVVASSMSLYGEGLYRTADSAIVTSAARDLAALRAGDWEVRDTQGAPLIPLPTPESKPPALASVYALSKYDQERLCLLAGRAYGIPTVALRFFNTYGPRQALGNPYTGVLAIFASRLLNGKPPLIHEDGRQRRDFVSVHDVARACRMALEAPLPRGELVCNVGSGEHRSVLEVAGSLAAALGAAIEPELTGTYRVGDIRHCYADISLARQALGYAPRVRFEDGLAELVEWLRGQGQTGDGAKAVPDKVEEAQAELAARGLAIPAAGRAQADEAARREPAAGQLEEVLR